MNANISPTTTTLYLERPEGCECGNAEIDNRGNIVRVRSCPVCSKIHLDILRGIEYSSDTQEGVRRTLKQQELFSPEAYSSEAECREENHGV